MTTCPSCGIAGNNLSCPNHSYWGINPLPDSIPAPKQSPIDLSPYIDEEKKWLFAETGRLHLSLSKANKEIERLKGLMPPDERGPGFVGQGSWSVFAEKVVAERDALRDEIVKRDKEIERLRDKIGPLGRENHLLCNLRDNLFEERRELKECLRWYVENDDTNEGGKWEESNVGWLEGKRRAMRALGMEEE